MTTTMRDEADAASDPVSPQAAIMARLVRLEAMESIRALKAHYTALADAKYTPNYQRQAPDVMMEIAKQQAQCFTSDAVWAGGNGFGDDLTGYEALHAWFQRSPWRFALHYYTGENIVVSSDATQAQATWRLFQIALRDDDGHAVLLGATTHEQYRYVTDIAGPSRWLISHMRFEQIHMLEPATGGLPIASNFAALDAKRITAKP